MMSALSAQLEARKIRSTTHVFRGTLTCTELFTLSSCARTWQCSDVRMYPSSTMATTSRWNGPLPQRLQTTGIMKVRPQNGKRSDRPDRQAMRLLLLRVARKEEQHRTTTGTRGERDALVPEHRSQPDLLFVTRRPHKRGECAPSAAADSTAAVYTRQPAFPHSTRLPSSERRLLPDASRLQLGRASSADRKRHAHQIFSVLTIYFNHWAILNVARTSTDQRVKL